MKILYPWAAEKRLESAHGDAVGFHEKDTHLGISCIS